jgi:anaerobic C4-dicarboxylate transporter DcuA/anaerobic C4-dicarboxylate transporter DcuB
MAAMLTLTDIAPYNLGLTEILAITIPSCVIGIVVTSIVVGKMGKDLDDDPEVQAKIASGELVHWSATSQPVAATVGGSGSAGDSAVGTEVPGSAPAPMALSYTKEGRNSALAFLFGVVSIEIYGLFPDLRPSFPVEGGESVSIDMTTTIVMVMFVIGVVILLIGRPDVKEVPEQSVFKAGMISAIALFGIAWLTATFISAHEEYIIDTVGGWVTDWKFIFALAVFLVAALTTSQSTATRTIVPIGLAAGLAPGIVTGMWAGALCGVYTLPANGTQIAAANFDHTGTTKLGTKLIDHSFFVPMLIMSVVTIAVGALIGGIFF